MSPAPSPTRAEPHDIITDAAGVAALCAEMQHAGVIGIDTESDQFHAYNPKVCLVQVATRWRTALIDTVDLDGEDMAPLSAILADPGVVKIMHAGRNDVLGFQRDFGSETRNLFDTCEAARFLGYDGHSLESVLARHFDVELVKSHQRLDWRRRPLPESALAYAAQDVIFLAELRFRLIDELEASEWMEPHRQWCEHIVNATRYEPTPFDPEQWRRVKGAKALDRQSQAVLRELYLWRHGLCTKLNRAALFVCDDSALMRLTRAQPRSLEDLEGMRGISRGTLQRRGSEIVDAVDRGLARRDPLPPATRRNSGRRRSGGRPSRAEQAVFQRLRAWRNASAELWNLPADLIAPNDTLMNIAKAGPDTPDALRAVEGVLPWLVERLGGVILDTLEDDA